MSDGQRLTDDELKEFLDQLSRNKHRDEHQVDDISLVTSSSEVHWLTPEQTGNPSSIGLLKNIPNRTSEFLLQRIPAGSATDLQRHTHESVHYVVSGTGYVEIGYHTLKFNPGDFAYTPPWVWHRFYANADADVEMIIVENSRVLDALDAGMRESRGNVSFGDAFGASTQNPTP